VLLVLAPLASLSLAGQEHGRTIPLADHRTYKYGGVHTIGRLISKAHAAAGMHAFEVRHVKSWSDPFTFVITTCRNPAWDFVPPDYAMVTKTSRATRCVSAAGGILGCGNGRPSNRKKK
ncbi:hypothetical protein, partial [Bradyrhizobium liaoningense]